MPGIWLLQPEIDKSDAPHLEDETAEEPPYQVIIHNDDVTPMDFVIAVLMRIFDHALIMAESIMWQAHTQGHAYVATYSLAEARKRVGQAHFAATLEGYPLHFTLEPAS